MIKGRLLSVGLFVITLAVGVGVGRGLGADNSPTTTTTVPEAAPATTVPSLIAEILEPTGPTLREMAPTLTEPLYLETANPTQLLRWDLDEPAPRPVRDIPPGTDLHMDQAARFVVVVLSHHETDLLLGGLVGTPLSILAEDVSDVPRRMEFDDTFWFRSGEHFVVMDTRGTEVNRHPVPDLLADTSVDRVGGQEMTLADDDGLIIQQWYDENGSLVAVRALVRSGGILALPGGAETYPSALTPDEILIRTRRGGATSTDRATGVTEDIDYDGACGITSISPNGLRASTCNGAVIISDFGDQYLDVGTWTTGRWSASGAWYMAVGGYFGEVLLVDAATGETIKVPFPLAKNALVVDVWSGA